MAAAKPSLELLRELSDEHVLTALMDEPRLTRSELASKTGISKPTVSESVRRLVGAGVVADTGERTSGRGRIGVYYALSRDVGLALVASISPDGVVSELVDAHGIVVAHATEHIPRPARAVQVSAALRRACRQVQKQYPGALRLAVISAADPVDRATGRLVHLPDAPFLLGELAPADVLSNTIEGSLLVDNDVNWAARAEQAIASPGVRDDFVYLYLDEGVGCAVVSDGMVRRGHNGLTGEIAHLLTSGADGRACPLIEVFGQLNLRQRNSTAIDTAKLLRTAGGHSARNVVTTKALARAVGGVLSAIVALTDPAVVVIGGNWGTQPAIMEALIAEASSLARPPRLQPAAILHEAPLQGARTHAVEALRRYIIEFRGRRGPGDL